MIHASLPRSVPAALGAFAACLYRHVQVSSALDTLLDDPAALARYKVLYLADETSLSPRRIANVAEFVRNGGGLVAGYGTSLYDEAGRRQERFGLEELQGLVKEELRSAYR